MKKGNLKVILLFCFSICVVFLFYSINSHAENTLTKYKIQVNFDDKSKTLNGVESVTYTNNYKNSLNDLVLHLYPNSYSQSPGLPTIGNGTTKKLTEEEKGNISIVNATIENKAISFSQDKQVLKFKLNTPLESGHQIVFQIDFTVKIPLGTDRLGYTNDVYSITNWYPIMSIYDTLSNTWDENEYNPIGESNYSDVSDYSVILNTPKNIVTASTGVVQKEFISGDTKTLEINASNIRDFVFMMSKYYKVISTTDEGIKINSFYIESKSSEDTSSSAKKILEVVSDSEKFYSKTYGKYPYPELDVVETYLSGGAMEYPSLIQMGKYQALTNNSIDDHSSWLEDAAAHETGHQWWYVAVGNNEFKEPMMDESINTFSTAYYFEKRYGKYNKNSLTMKFRNNLVTGKTLPINTSVDKFGTWSDYTNVIYQKGPEIFDDLLNRVGEEKFLNIMRTYYSRFEFKNGSINDFLNVVGDIGGKNIESIISNNINSDNYCPLNLKITADEKMHIDNLDIISDLTQRESVSGLTLGSILLRGLNGEAINIIIPSKLSVSENKNVIAYVNTIKANFNKYFNIKINIIKDNVINSTQLNQNIIVLGNPDNNKVMKDLKNNLPIDMSKPSFSLKNDKITTSKASGIYLIKNPKNKINLLTVIFWKNTLHKYDFILDNLDQYVINYGESDEIRGQF